MWPLVCTKSESFLLSFSSSSSLLLLLLFSIIAEAEYGCGGGDTAYALNYLQRNGVWSEADYPDTAAAAGKTSPCPAPASQPKVGGVGAMFRVFQFADRRCASCDSVLLKLLLVAILLCALLVCSACSILQHYSSSRALGIWAFILSREVC